MIADEYGYDEQLQKLAEVGASLCTYLPGAGDPEMWPSARCDCKYLPVGFDMVDGIFIGGEQTGCCEVRHAYRALVALRDQAHDRAALRRHGT